MNVNVHKDMASPCYKLRRSFENCQGHVSNLLDELRQWMTQIGVPDDKITDVQIVLAEALNNVIEHGFAQENSGTVEVDVKVSDGITTIQVTDNGQEFTPPQVMQTPLEDNSDLNDLPEGGFGWFLIKEITSSYEFHRVSNKNQLVLNFH